jgi:peptidoglycan/LPS O-acetylase OafA/YrhL
MTTNQASWASLAALRFALATIVFATHFVFFTGYGGWIEAISSFDGKAAVVGFLLVSGFSIAASFDRDREGFYRRRFLRVYPLYFFAVLFAFGLEFMTRNHIDLPGHSFDGLGWMTALGNMAMLQTFVVKPIQYDVPVWSLSIEVFYYALAPLFARLPRNWLVTIIAVSLICYALPKHSDWGIAYTALSKFNAMNYMWCWLLGFMLWKDRGPVIIALALIGVPEIIFGHATPDRFAVVTYVSTLLILLLSHRIAIPGRLEGVAEYLGDLSYPLYLYHLPTLILGYVVFEIHSPVALLALVIVVTVAAFHGIDRALKKRFIAPLMFKPRGLRGSKSPSTATLRTRRSMVTEN